MKRHVLALAAGTLAAFSSGTLSTSGATAAPYKHVLLISVDGLHALDLANYAARNPASSLAALVHTGIFYPNALTSAPSDSFPGFVAQVTGGTPKSTGVFYDDSYDRTYFAPASDCKGLPGAEVAFAENIDVDSTRLDAGGKPGDFRSQIDPAKLPMTLINGKCSVVYPHDFVRVNNVFEIVRAHGGRTAWSDKHPAYEWLNGPSGKGVDDLYALEQDSLIPGTKVKTTGSFKAEQAFDEARVKAVINEIKGLDSTGSHPAPVPELFGMNFQAVSVGQKLPKAGPGDEQGLVGGYLDASGSPTNGLAGQLAYVDGALGELIAALRDNRLADSTLIILASKHGQSPIDPATFQPLDDDPYTKTPGYAFHIADDAALIWLKPQDRTKNLAAAQDYLEKSSKAEGIAQIQTPNALALAYQDPATDSRTPDFIATVNPGVVYTSGSKIAEHGGANANDRNVALLISSPSIEPRSVPALVQTAQVAPTILRALGYDASELQAVKLEGTQDLPAIPF
ncbi:MAG: nucleotide pyrophosphatase [Mesorhizobium sp. SCN 65-20]|nr:MAG: nucleotide pyrophosphatase [Mesorhizobium sp. SCN 65-20]